MSTLEQQVNDAVMREFGVPVEFTIDAVVVPVTGILNEHTDETPVGNTRARQPGYELQVITDDLAGLTIIPGTAVSCIGLNFEVIAPPKPGISGMTTLMLRRVA